MASKSASGRRRMQKAVQKSQTSPTGPSTSRPSSPHPPRHPPPRATPSPLFFQLPSRAKTPQPSTSALRRVHASSPKLRWAELRAPSPLPHSNRRRYHSTDRYPSPPPSAPSSPPSAPLLVSSTLFPPTPSPAPGPSKEPKKFVQPSPSRRGATNPPTRSTKLDKGKKGANGDGSMAQATHPSRFRALLSREKKIKQQQSIDSLFPSRTAARTRNETRTRKISGQPDHFSEERFLAKDTWVRKHEMRLHPYQSTAPYPVAFDYDALEGERMATILLKRVNPNGSLSPSFHDYENHPPLSVLDLGCGAGYWVRDAASAWKHHGTVVTGFDMVNVTKGVLTPDSEDVNYTFVRGNFLTKKLPFANESFDLVRMANLSLCIPFEKWDFILEEVHRVLTIGGRLELIDDEIIFPYSSAPKSHFPSSPGRKFSLPSTLSLSSTGDPILARGDDESEVFARRSLDSSSSSTPKSRLQRPSSAASDISPRSDSANGHMDPLEWARHASSSREMEAIFESMLSMQLRIHPRPSAFLLDAIKAAFGRRSSSLLKTMELCLAPPDTRVARHYNHHQENDAFALRPGLILMPDTLVTMPPAEMARHAYKHIDTLLGCKSAMADYVELQEEDGARVVDQEFWNAWSGYESFAQHRFDLHLDPDPSLTDLSEFSLDSDVVEAAEDYQSILSSRFNWREESVLGNDYIPTMLFRPSSPLSVSSTTRSFSTLAPRGEELLHIRTIRVYQATKTSNNTFPF